MLKASNGSIRSVTTSDNSGSRSRRSEAPAYSSTSSRNLSVPKNRPVSPVSIPDAIQVPQRIRPTRIPSEPTISIPRSSYGSTAQAYPAGQGPNASDTDNGYFAAWESTAPKRRVRSSIFPRNHPLRSPLSSELDSKQPRSRKLSLRGTSSSKNKENAQKDAPEPVPTAQMANDNDDVSKQGPSTAPPQLSAVDSATSQGICLPSPSLSPVAAMNALNTDSFFDSVEDADGDTDSSLDQAVPQFSRPLKLDKLREGGPCTAASEESTLSKGSRQHAAVPSLNDIPATIDMFDSVPEELKAFLMYQFLKRCSKPTLQFVAGIVNPALKCDFLDRLPLELSLNIVKYFDVQTMCRAAQVSKKWRLIVDSDERTWKQLFEDSSFVLQDGELERSIREGWGWQFPVDDEYADKDLSLCSPSRSDGKGSPASDAWSCLGQAESPQSVSPLPNRRTNKRKAATRVSSRKLPKRRDSYNFAFEKDSPGSPEWQRHIAAAEGPYGAASAAAAAVPYPDIGLPSLRSLHLYKSLYQRHHSIRMSWMNPNIEPRHIAFSAHNRRVVTCLQFDTDKILTGSDDTNINVYDTRTGLLRTTLEGHEGGVWALEYHGNTLVSGSTDRSVRVWDIENAKCTQVFHGHTSTVRCLQIVLPTEVGQNTDGTPLMMPKEPLVITGSRDSNLRVWKLPKSGDASFFPNANQFDDSDCPYFVRTLSGHQHSVRAIAAHGDALVSGSYDCTVRVWKISTGETLHRLQGHTMKVYSVVLDHKRKRCISGSMDNMVKVWSIETGSLLYNLEGHTSLVGLLDLKDDRLVSAAADSTLRVWDPDNGQCKSRLSAHTGAITCFQHDGQKVVSGSDRTLKMWNVQTGECVRDLLTDLSGVWQVKFNDRRCVAAVQRDHSTFIEVSNV